MFPVITISLTFIAKLAFYLTVTIYAIFSGVLFYHWENYSTNNSVTKITYLTFLVITLPLLFIMIIYLFFII
ncbi:hypothetical protein COZ82_01715 [Candidatus Kaiserbacteria bacterium CG_4_8_14_3_um_filter_38_9]|uniref:Uncharacterized protein n=1 Tax=Candidatus Kaiserbacteria bacterium CG_4_8_14_3_um_filter_38_9 TaxID=1974599 RepID=A0A2M7IP46_9BACT|nr:MAG: hypothetical protein COZ82_01715 [Candidatus Kaiserbacteria bacterium CG_4_8_14_3_um_filter_38_9]